MIVSVAKALAAMIAVSIPSVVLAGPVYVSVQNRITTEQIDVSNVSSCNTITPPLGSVAANTQSGASGVNCGSSSYMAFDYSAPSGKKCSYFAGSYIQGTTNQPQGSAKSNGTIKASCKLYLVGNGGIGGGVSFLATME